MRYEKGHREATRRHIVEVASRQFRENGVAAAGIAGIMSAAGLTNGAFYLHFDSKEDLVHAVLGDERERGLENNLRGDVGLEESIRNYLASRHRDNAGSGCPTAALVAEIARHPAKTREIFTKKVEEIIDLIAGHLRHGSTAGRRRKATAIYGVIVGSLQLARAVNDRKLSDEILENAIESALTLAGGR
jgi:TetR/AcrR family transcriptional regulator, transcriptional repressor for nem operon